MFLKSCFTSRSVFPDNIYKMADSFCFQAKVASRDYHVYKVTTWRNAMENEKSLLKLNWMKFQNKSTHIAVLFRPNLLKLLWELVTYPERFLGIVISLRKKKEGRLMAICLVQLIDLDSFHQAVWRFLWFCDFEVRNM